MLLREEPPGVKRDSMISQGADSPLRVRLSEDRRKRLIAAVKGYFEENFDDEPLSDFRAQGLLDFFVRELCPPVYNQGVHDACAAMQEKLVDLEGEVYEKDLPQ
jgi:uncharacterized protein (DUF2164 family)